MNYTRPALGFSWTAKCIEAFLIHGESPLELEDLSLVASSIASASPKSLKAEIVWNYQQPKSGKITTCIKRSVVDGRVNLARKKDVLYKPNQEIARTRPHLNAKLLFFYLRISWLLWHKLIDSHLSLLNDWQFHCNRCQMKWVSWFYSKFRMIARQSGQRYIVLRVNISILHVLCFAIKASINQL